MKDEKLQTEEISIKNSKFLTWFDNFWYHYKWHTIVTVFIILVLGISIIQSCTSEKTDVVFTYAGPKEFVTSPEEKTGINNALGKVCADEYGEKANAYLNSFLIYSKEQIEDIQSELDDNGNQKYQVDTAFNTSQMNSFFEYSQSGASVILLLDPSIYQSFIDASGNSERLVELSTIYGTTPDGAFDKYSVRLGDTEIYQNVPELRALPENTLICFHSQLILSTNKKDYDKQMQIFKQIATLSKIQADTSAE